MDEFLYIINGGRCVVFLLAFELLLLFLDEFGLFFIVGDFVGDAVLDYGGGVFRVNSVDESEDELEVEVGVDVGGWEWVGDKFERGSDSCADEGVEFVVQFVDGGVVDGDAFVAEHFGESGLLGGGPVLHVFGVRVHGFEGGDDPFGEFVVFDVGVEFVDSATKVGDGGGDFGKGCCAGGEEGFAGGNEGVFGNVID